MSAQLSIHQLLEKAAIALQQEKYDLVFNNIDEVLVLDPKEADAYILKGITLARLDRNDEATDAFKKAIELDPQNSKAYYNYGTHLFYLNQKEEALKMFNETLKLDPDHESALELKNELDPEFAPTFMKDQNDPIEQLSKGRLPQTPIGHMLNNLGQKWIIIGWILILVTFGLTMYLNITLSPEVMKLLPKNYKIEDVQKAVITILESNPLFYGVLNITLMIAYLSSISWMAIDIIGRGGKLIWLVPFLLLTFLTRSIVWFLMIIYIVFIRKRIGIRK